MNILLLAVIILCLAAQNFSKKSYSLKYGAGAVSFSATSVVCSLIFCLITSNGCFYLSKELIVYTFLFAVFFSAAVLFSVLGVKEGLLSLTSFVNSFSLLIPTFYGLLVLKEPFLLKTGIGLCFLIFSLFLINFKKDKNKHITAKWCVFVMLSFIGNGGCATVQKIYQVNSPNVQIGNFMIFSYFFAAIFLVVIALFSERRHIFKSLKTGKMQWSVAGISNAMVNLLVLKLSSRVNASFMFPVMSAGSILLTLIISIAFFKERLTLLQKCGIVSGIVSIIFLNL